MSPRKIAKVQPASNRALMSDYGEMPGCRTDEYRDMVKSARQKFDRLDAFSCDELEAMISDVHNGKADWDSERIAQLKALDRWAKSTFVVIGKLLELFHQVRDDKKLLEIVSLERSTRKVTRSKRPKSDIRKLSR